MSHQHWPVSKLDDYGYADCSCGELRLFADDAGSASVRRARERYATVAEPISVPPEPEPESTTSEPAEASGAVVVTLSTVQPERLEWLWPGRLPAGKLVTLDGDPSVGKSTVAVDWAARISTGKPWPDGAECSVGDVVIMSAEDGLADTIRPRLDAAGGDPGRVHALTSVRTVADGKVITRPVTLADVASIRDAVERVSARLLVVDVLMAYMPGKVDSHKDQDIRAVLHRLAEMATATGCTILMLRHLNKSGGGSALYRGGGSIGIVGAARAGFLIAPDPEDDQVRVLAGVKANLAAMPDSLSYRLDSAPGSDVARVVWLGTSEHSAAGLLSVGPDDGDDRREIDRWLLDLLTDHGGSVAAKDIYRAGRDSGYSPDQIKRAKKRSPIEAVKGGMGTGWSWTLVPEGSAKGAKSAPPGEPPPSLPSVLPSDAEEVA